MTLLDENPAAAELRIEQAVGVATTHPFLRFAFRRLLAGLVTLWVVSMLVFAAVNTLPGNVAEAVLGKTATPTEIRTLQVKLGLNHSLVSQYWSWLTQLLHGNLGQSAAAVAAGATGPNASAGSTSVWAMIDDPLRNTLILAGLVIVLLFPLSLALGTILGARAGKPTDIAVGGATLVLTALPEFVLGTILLAIFFSWLHLFPPTTLVPPGVLPLDTPRDMVLPVLTLLLTNLAWTTRLVRAGIVEQLKTEWAITSRLNGFPERFILWRYALRNALAPSVQVFTLAAQYLFGGVVVTEILFAYPGLGTQFVNAVNVRDTTTVQAIAILIATGYIVLNIVADFVVMLLVPKLRTAQ